MTFSLGFGGQCINLWKPSEPPGARAGVLFRLQICATPAAIGRVSRDGVDLDVPSTWQMGDAESPGGDRGMRGASRRDAPAVPCLSAPGRSGFERGNLRHGRET
jgi:hypothetical protein